MTEHINIEPHWPGMLRWLEVLALDAGNGKPDAVAITGGADTDMYAVFDAQVMKFSSGHWIPARAYTPSGTGHDVTPEELLSVAYCAKIGDAITVNGDQVE